MRTLSDHLYQWERAKIRRRLKHEGRYAPTRRAARAMAAKDGHEFGDLSRDEQAKYWRWAAVALDSIFEEDL